MKKRYASLVLALSLLKEDLKDFFGKLFIKGYKSHIEQVVEFQRAMAGDNNYVQVSSQLPRNMLEVQEMIDVVTAIDSLEITALPEISDEAKEQISQLTTDDIKLLVEVLKTSPEGARKNSELAKRLAYVSYEYKQHVLEEGPMVAVDIATYDMFRSDPANQTEEEMEAYKTRCAALELISEDNRDYAKVSTLCSKMITRARTAYKDEYEMIEFFQEPTEGLTLSIKKQGKKL